MKWLAVVAVLGCSSAPPLVPFDSDPSATHGGPPIERLNHHAVEIYRKGDYDEAATRFINANAYAMSPQGFFNICLALYRSHERSSDAAKLNLACEACVSAFTLDGSDLMLVTARPRLKRLLDKIEVTAKQRRVTLTCDRTAAR